MPLLYLYIYEGSGDGKMIHIYSFSRVLADRRVRKWFPDVDPEKAFIRRDRW